MALTLVEKTQIIYLLGYPGKLLLEASTHYNAPIARRLDLLTPEIESIVRTLLSDITTTKQKTVLSQSRMLVKRVGDIELNTDENRSLRSEIHRLLNELANLLDIPNRSRGGAVGNVSLIV